MPRARAAFRALAAGVVTFAIAATIGPAQAFHYPWDQGHDTFVPEEPLEQAATCDARCGCRASPFIAATGTYNISGRDIFIPGRIPLDLTRTYNGRDLHSGMFGHGWTFSYGARAIPVTDGVDRHVIVRSAGGQRDRFKLLPDGSTEPPPDVFDTLTVNPDGTTRLVRPSGSAMEFDVPGNLTSMADTNGNRLTLGYDAVGFLTTVTDDDARSLVFTKGTNGKVASVTDPAGRITSYQYDENGSLVRVIDPAGGATVYAYDLDSNLVSTTDPRGNVIASATYTSDGRLASYTENGASYTLSYFADGNLMTETDSMGNTRSIHYNDNLNITRIVDPQGFSTETGYDANFNMNSIRDENGNLTTLSYDSNGNVLSTTDALAQSTHFTYEPQFHKVTSITAPSGAVTTFEYDEQGNETATIDALGGITTKAYLPTGELSTLTDPLGHQTTFGYDASGNAVETVDPLGHALQATYDVVGNLTSTTDALGRNFAFTHDVTGAPLQVTDPAGGVTTQAYDPAGNVVTATDENGNVTTFQYDELNRVTLVTNALAESWGYGYDARGTLATIDSPKGDTVQFGYDVHGRMVSAAAPDDTTTFSYDAAGNVLSVLDGDSGVHFVYDATARLIETRTDAVNGYPTTTITYAYDADGNKVGMTGPNGGVTDYTYDALNRLIEVRDPDGNTVQYEYDALSRPIAVLRSNGVRTDRSYDAAGGLVQLVHRIRGTTLIGYDFENDANGHRITVTDDGRTIDFTYDALDRLTGATSTTGAPQPESYAYDPAGNRTTSHLSASYAHDAANRLIADDTFDYRYDANGNLVEKEHQASGDLTRYTYDARNRRTRVDFPGGGFATYRYDGLGRRIEKNVDGVIQRFVYDGDDILLVLDGDGQVGARFVHGATVDEPRIVETGGQTYFYHGDAVGSVVGLTDSTGTLTRTITYGSFGRIVAESGAVTQPYAYTARERDVESGDYYYRARYYDPNVGRFASEDPSYRGAASPGEAYVPRGPYLYTDNNPVNYTDPSGLVTVASACKKFVPWVTQDVEAAARAAVLAIKDGCVKSESLKKRLLTVFKTLHIDCSYTQKECGKNWYLQPFGPKKIWLGRYAGSKLCSTNLTGTIIHEATHRASWSKSEVLAESCALSCTGQAKSKLEPSACAGDCK